MTALQKLVLERDTEDQEYDEGDEGYMEWQQRRQEQDELMYSRMQLPGTLHSLQLDRMPRPALRLPCVRELRLHACTLADEDFAQLSVGCPMLWKLQVKSVRVSPAAHTAPLACVTYLEVADAWHAHGAMRLAAILPALHQLWLQGFVACEQPREFFVGANALTELEACCGYGPEDFFHSGASLPVSMFEALGTLPCLRKVLLNVEPAHAEGAQLLTQVTRIAWTVNEERPDSFQQSEAAFSTYDARGRLTKASVLFQADGSNARAAAVMQLADAMVSRLVRAPAMRRVEWDTSKFGPGNLSHVQLAAMAMSSSIEQIWTDCEYTSFDPVPGSLMRMARLVASRRPVQVKIQYEYY